MAYYDLVWYCNAGDQATTGYYAVAKWAASAAITAGSLRRQLAVPAVGNERVFVCITSGTTGGTEPTWVITRGAKTTDNTVTWMEVTGIAAVNGDKINTVNWTAAKAIGTPTLGTIIQRNNGASYQICTTAGTLGTSEPAFVDTAGTTTPEVSATTVWTCIGTIATFTGGRAPHARMGNAVAANWLAAGGTVYVGDNHAETSAVLIQITPTGGSLPTTQRFICHNHAGNYPPTSADLMTTASVAGTGGAGVSLLNGSPSAGYYFYGITFVSNASSLMVSSGGCYAIFDNCSLQFTFSGNATVNFGSNGGVNILNSTTFKFFTTGQGIQPGTSNLIWQNTAPVLKIGSAIPAGGLINTSSSSPCSVVLEALDLSQLTAPIFTNVGGASSNLSVRDCVLGATPPAPAPAALGTVQQFVRSDAGARPYVSSRFVYEGAEMTDTSIVRVGGAVDPTGQMQSRKISTTANSQWLRPFRAEPYAIWNAVTAANVTVSVCGIVNSGVLLNNDDIWLEVEYLGSSATLGSMVTTTKPNVLAPNTVVGADSSTWNVSAFSNWNADDAAAVLISNRGLTATSTAAAPGGVRAGNGYNSGKLYFEIAMPTWASGATGVGLALATSALNIGSAAGQIVVQAATGTILINGSNSGYGIGPLVSGNTIGIAIDLATRLIWFHVTPAGNWNGVAANNPATGVGGVITSAITGALFPAFFPAVANEVAIANFGGSAFNGTLPSGFSGWSSSWTPFKLSAILAAPHPGMPGYIHARVRAAKPSTTWYIDPQITLS